VLGDLWRFIVNDSTWTWISGSSMHRQPAVFGEKGVPSTDYTPGTRQNGIGWYDSLREEFWLFGGHGYYHNSSFSGA